MAQKRKLHVKTPTGLEEQLIASSADIVEIDPIAGLDASNVQEALESLVDIANEGGVTGVKGSAETEYRCGQVNITKDNIGLGNVTNDEQVKRSEMGASGGVATLDATGKVPTSQLPSYVDDVLEYTNRSAFPSTGESGKIYVALDENKTYRWGGTAYVEIAQGLTLGETSSTAYAGDKGKALADKVTDLTHDAQDRDAWQKSVVDGDIKVGSAESSDKLKFSRKISLSGDTTGNATFNGSADVTINTELSNTGVTAGTYTAVAVDTKGRITAGNQIVEWGASGQIAPSASLAVGGLFFALVE